MIYATIGILVLVGICVLVMFVAMGMAVEHDRKNPNWYKRVKINGNEPREDEAAKG